MRSMRENAAAGDGSPDNWSGDTISRGEITYMVATYGNACGLTSKWRVFNAQVSASPISTLRAVLVLTYQTPH